jgi:hypothetical protein
MSLVRVSSRRSRWFLALSAATTLGGCSFLYDLQTTQCEVHQDCKDLGPQFNDTICVNRVCVEDDGAGATGGSSGNGGSSGSSGGTGKGGSSGTSVEAGAGGSSGDTGATGGSSGSSGKGGSSGSSGKGGAGGTGGSSGSDVGGAGSGPECETNGECIDSHNSQEYICQDGSCVGLLNANCPIMIPEVGRLDLLRAEAPLIVGGFANLTNNDAPRDSQAVINWDLAFSEFNAQTLGGFPGDDGKRPVLGIICKSATDAVANMEHLAGTLRLPAILSTLSADNLDAAFAYTQSDTYVEDLEGKSVFFMSTGSADLRLATLDDNGLVWHQLGNPRVLARTMAGLLALVEPIVEERRRTFYNENIGTPGVENPDEVPLRVTLVTSDDVTMRDVSTVLTSRSPEDTSTMLYFNGLAAIDQQGDGGADPGDFRRVTVESIRNDPMPDVAAALSDVAANPPHVIIAMGTSEFASHILPDIENSWSSGENTATMPRPHYLMSHFIYTTDELRTSLAASGHSPDLRIVGVNYAAAQDEVSQDLYNDYFGRLQASYQGTLNIAGTENHYDGAYALLYALAAASGARDMPVGIDIRDGLDRVLDPGAPTVYVGPNPIATTVNSLSNNLSYDMGLWGTMGPPDFDRVTGTRVTATSAWCIEKVSTVWTYRPDGLLFHPEDSSFTPAATVPACLQPYEP